MLCKTVSLSPTFPICDWQEKPERMNLESPLCPAKEMPHSAKLRAPLSPHIYTLWKVRVRYAEVSGWGELWGVWGLHRNMDAAFAGW